jgi:hypothetical protein
MYFPTYHTLNFYDNPQSIVDYANSLEFLPSDGNYPGRRTRHLHEIDYDLFTYSCTRVLNMIYGTKVVEQNNISYVAKNSFQKIKTEDIKNVNKGWVHVDADAKITAIIYLTPGKNVLGTSIFTAKREGKALTDQTIKKEAFKNKTIENVERKFQLGLEDEQFKKRLMENNERFEEVARFNCKFNSMLVFDGANYHGANFDELQPGEERLTQIIFFNEISAPYYPIPDMRRTH